MFATIPAQYQAAAEDAVNALHWANIDSTPIDWEHDEHIEIVNVDWQDAMGDDAFVDAFLKDSSILTMDDEDAEDLFEEWFSNTYGDGEPEPVGSAWWPVTKRGIATEVAKDLLLHSNNCALLYNTDTQEYGLVLTGGGMDLSWDIAQAYVLCGQRPPVALSLPNFAGEGWDQEKANTFAALTSANKGMLGRIQANLERLEEVSIYLSKQG